MVLKFHSRRASYHLALGMVDKLGRLNPYFVALRWPYLCEADRIIAGFTRKAPATGKRFTNWRLGDPAPALHEPRE